ncbi:hypothetical protein A3759_12395 [Thalassolituus sp. HI0120]|jgi:hypothetical protein|nr:hypothetical protein A3759_12395 [Thalassolituus sp. HI0120]
MQFKKSVLSALVLTAALTGCKDSSDNEPAQTREGVETSGRLLVSNASTENPTVSVINPKGGSVLETITLNSAAEALNASPQYRYGLVSQDGQVQIIDGGLYLVPHDDHFDLSENDPQLISKTLTGTKPAHFRHNEEYAAFFFDGVQGTSSKVITLDDEAITDDEERELQLNNNMHGTAEPRDEFLLTTYRAPEASADDQLPSAVELYHYHDGEFEKEELTNANCDKLHGSFSTEEASVFGCSDSVLVVKQEGENFTASTIANPAEMTGRIGSFTGHSDAHVVAGWASNALYAIHLEDDEIELVDWSEGEGATKHAAIMDDEGEAMLVLDDTGTLHVLSVHEEHNHGGEGESDGESAGVTAASAESEEEHTFERTAKIKVLETIPAFEGHDHVEMAVSPDSDEVFVVDSVAKQIVVVDLAEKEVKERIALSFEPSKLAWVGAVGEHKHHHGGDDHNHGGDDHNHGGDDHNHGGDDHNHGGDDHNH